MAMLTNAAFRPPFLNIHPSFYQNPGKGNEEEVLTNVEDVAYTSISPITPISLLNTNNNNSGQNQTQALGQNRTEGTRPTSQICGKSRHTALDCYNKMDFSYQRKHPPVKLAAMASAQTGESWLADFGATNHLSANLGNLSVQQPYSDAELVTVGNGQGLPISHIGNSTLPNSSDNFQLKYILRVPHISL